MRKQILFLAISTIGLINCYSQIVFENGYFINETDQKMDCLIKNVDWKNNPTNFEYKIIESDDIKIADIQNVKEFGINGVNKYIRALVKIDRASDNINELGAERNPNFKEEQLFLKVLIEGKASLYQYENGNLIRFFYKINDSEIEQLVYKRFLIKDNFISENNYFRQQLLLNLKCQDITKNKVENLNYYKRDLERFFVTYNKCNDSPFVNFEAKQEKDLFNLTIRPGLNISNLTIQNSSTDSKDTDFGTNFSFRFGVEAEFNLPFNKNKWATIIEPTFQYFKSEKTTETNQLVGNMLVTNVNYKSIELPVGIRYYFFLKNKSKIFINAAYIFDFSYNSSIEFSRSDGTILNSLEIKSGNNMALGIGYKYKDRYNVELRYQTSREILGEYAYWNSDYKTLSIVFGYSLF